MALGKLGVKRTVVIPQDICDRLSMTPGDIVEVQDKDGEIIIRPMKVVPAQVATEDTD